MDLIRYPTKIILLFYHYSAKTVEALNMR